MVEHLSEESGGVGASGEPEEIDIVTGVVVPHQELLTCYCKGWVHGDDQAYFVATHNMFRERCSYLHRQRRLQLTETQDGFTYLQRYPSPLYTSS